MGDRRSTKIAKMMVLCWHLTFFISKVEFASPFVWAIYIYIESIEVTCRSAVVKIVLTGNLRWPSSGLYLLYFFATVLFTCIKSWFFRNYLANFLHISHWSFCWNVIDSLFKWSCYTDCQAHISFFKTKSCSNDDIFISCNDRIGKMLHNICMSAVAMSLRWVNRGPWASCLWIVCVLFSLKKKIFFREKNKSWHFIWIVVLREKRWHFMWTVCLADNSHEMSSLISSEKCFSEEIKLVISCKLSSRQTIHRKCQVLFSLKTIKKKKKKNRMSSASIIVLHRLSIYIFSYFSTKTYVVGPYQKHILKALLIITHKICFHWELRKLFIWFPCYRELWIELYLEPWFRLVLII